MASGTAFVTDLGPDPRLFGQSGNSVRTACLALIDQVVVQLAIAVDLAAFVPGLADERDLASVVFRSIAEWIVQPTVESTRMDAKAATHLPYGKPRAMLGDEGVSHFASLAKYAVAFLRNSQSWLVR